MFGGFKVGSLTRKKGCCPRNMGKKTKAVTVYKCTQGEKGKVAAVCSLWWGYKKCSVLENQAVAHTNL